MHRTPRIKWTRSQVGRLSAAVRAYNKAIADAIAANPTRAEYFPEPVTYQQMKSQITSARQLRNVVNRLNRSKRDSAFDLVKQNNGELITRYERNEARIIQSVNERRKSQQRKRMGIESEAGIRTGHMKTLRENALMPASIGVNDMDVRRIRRMIEVRDRTSPRTTEDRAAAMYENYLKALDTEGFKDFSKSFYNSIKAQISEWIENEPDFLVWAFESHDETLTIDFVYDPFQSLSDRAKYLAEGWRSARAEWEEKHGTP